MLRRPQFLLVNLATGAGRHAAIKHGLQIAMGSLA